jgi:hypothetical protein
MMGDLVDGNDRFGNVPLFEQKATVYSIQYVEKAT